jgi:hypothetical protein
MTNFTTLNNPKHFVALGRAVGKRFSKDGYENIVSTLTDRIKRSLRWNTNQYGFVRSPHNRNSFGDVDLVISRASAVKGWQEKFRNHVFGADFCENIKGTDTWVFDYNGHQVNVHVYEGNITHALVYLRNDGMGTLLSILANSLDMEFDIDGLRIKTGIPETPTLDIQCDIAYRTQMLGINRDSIDYYTHNEKDIFQLVLGSIYFNRKPFLDLENSDLAASSPILTKFIAYLKAVPKYPNEQVFSPDTNADHKNHMVLNFENYAPRTIQVYSEMRKRSKILEMFEAKFNTEKVSEITGLTGGLLMEFMNSFARSHRNADNFQKYILSSLPETITGALLAHKAATVTAEDMEAQKVIDAAEKVKADKAAAKALAAEEKAAAEAAAAQAALDAIPKLVGKAKAKAKAAAKKEKEPELPPAKLAKVAKTPVSKATPAKKVKIQTSTGETHIVEVTPEMAAESRARLTGTYNTAPAWPTPRSRAG